MMNFNKIIFFSLMMSMAMSCADSKNGFTGGSKKVTLSPSAGGDADGVLTEEEKNVKTIGEVDPWDDMSDHQFNEDQVPSTSEDPSNSTSGTAPTVRNRGMQNINPVGESSLQQNSKCRYLDPQLKEQLPAEEVAGGPPIATPMAKFIATGQVKDKDVIFRFSAFKHISEDRWITEETWADKKEAGGQGGVAGWVPHNYDAILLNAESEQCTIEAKFSNTDVRTLSGCFAIETEIMTKSGYKAAYSLRIGDELYNPEAKIYQEISEIRLGAEKKPMIKIVAGSYAVKVTETHPFKTADGIKQARELTTSDRLMTENHAWAKISALEPIPVSEGTMVVNFVLAGAQSGFNEHHLLANGIASGDLYMQRQVEAARLKESKAREIFVSLNLLEGK